MGNPSLHSTEIHSREVVAPRREAVRDESPSDSGTVLIIDDERMIRTVASRMLTRAGFEVSEAEGGEEAVELLGARGKEIVAVVLDMTMPGMDGEATYHALRRIRPDVPILFCSGLGEDHADEMLEGKTRVKYLKKPFSLATLTSGVREVLESR